MSDTDSSERRRFAIALSFPGERRDYVEQVANALLPAFGGEQGKARIFYDAWHEGKNRHLYIMRVYEFMNSKPFLDFARVVTGVPTIRMTDAQATLYRSGHFLTHLGETNPTALILGLSALAVLLLGKVFLKNKPVGMLVVIGGIAVASFLNIEARGVKILGEVPQGLPQLGLPVVHWADLNELLPLAIERGVAFSPGPAFFLDGAGERTLRLAFSSVSGGRIDEGVKRLAEAIKAVRRQPRARRTDHELVPVV